MAIYDGYAVRDRIGAGVAIKHHQNRTIFEAGLAYSLDVPQRILEIGPGDGYIAAMASAAGHPYVAIEGSGAVAERLRQRGVEVHDGYVPPLPASIEGQFSCCFMLHVLEHMPSPQAAAQVLGEIGQRLAPGGALVIAAPDYAQWGSRFFDCDYTHTLPLTRRRVAQMLADEGFEVAHHTVYVGPFFSYAALPIAWLGRTVYPNWLDALIGRHIKSDSVNRGLLTFMPNLLTIARRRR